MSKTVEIGPVPPEERTLGALDLFLIWAGANIVATTLAVGSSLEPSLRRADALAIIAIIWARLPEDELAHPLGDSVDAETGDEPASVNASV